MTACCPLCASQDYRTVFSAAAVPVLCNRLLETEADAKNAPMGMVELSVCSACGLIWNRAFEPEMIGYQPGYENALHFSPVFRDYAENLADRLVRGYDLVGRNVIEIGCGDGHMLDTMVRHGVGSAVGFDPSSATDTPFSARDEVEIVQEYFQLSHADRPFDAVLCRHVLEHIDEPVPFLSMLRAAIGNRKTAIYFEVPNAEWLVSSYSIWDVIYEHVTYWTFPSIETLLRRTGFEPVRLSAAYGDQFLQAEATPSYEQSDFLPKDGASGVDTAIEFGRFVDDMFDQWRRHLRSLSGSAVLWGAGSKAVSFVNLVEGAEALVDLNPRKHGLRVPGAGLPVVAPEALLDIRPELIIVSNGLYEAEIRDQVNAMGLQPRFEVLAA